MEAKKVFYHTEKKIKKNQSSHVQDLYPNIVLKSDVFFQARSQENMLTFNFLL